jgi:uncharacterized damage-inducible protein DinB
MPAKDAIKFLLESDQHMVGQYLSDLSDADLLVRPVPGANHIAWQLGHLIASEAGYFLGKVPGSKPPALPAGFAEQHDNKNAGSDTGFSTKDQYLKLFNDTRGATLTALDQLSEADLDKESGWDMAPTVGKLLLFVATHDMMHAGQFTVVRRKLGKPVLF